MLLRDAIIQYYIKLAGGTDSFSTLDWNLYLINIFLYFTAKNVINYFIRQIDIYILYITFEFPKDPLKQNEGENKMI